MLPRIHLGTLVTASDTHAADRIRKRKQTVMDARVSRSMEGVYIYQAYLKRLRRMHRAYVAKQRKQQQQQQAQAFNLSSSSTSSFAPSNYSNNNNSNRAIRSQGWRVTMAGFTTANGHQHHPSFTNHRLSFARGGDGGGDYEETTLFPSTPANTPRPGPVSLTNIDESPEYFDNINKYNYVDGVSVNDIISQPLCGETNRDGHRYSWEDEFKSKAIRIPCGREDSVEVFPNAATTLTGAPCCQVRKTKASTPPDNNNSYLPFRLWKQNKAKSLYSQPAAASTDRKSSTSTFATHAIPPKHNDVIKGQPPPLPRHLPKLYYKERLQFRIPHDSNVHS